MDKLDKIYMDKCMLDDFTYTQLTDYYKQVVAMERKFRQHDELNQVVKKKKNKVNYPLGKVEKLRMERSKLPFSKIMAKMKERLSFFSLYNLYDKIEEQETDKMQVIGLVDQKMNLIKKVHKDDM